MDNWIASSGDDIIRDIQQAAEEFLNSKPRYIHYEIPGILFKEYVRACYDLTERELEILEERIPDNSIVNHSIDQIDVFLRGSNN